jgi:hypothetical protein
MIVNNEFEIMWVEAVMELFLKYVLGLFRNLCGLLDRHLPRTTQKRC